MKARVWSETSYAENWFGKLYLGKWVDVKIINVPQKGFGSFYVWLDTEIGEWCYVDNHRIQPEKASCVKASCVFDEIDDELRNEIYLRLLT